MGQGLLLQAWRLLQLRRPLLAHRAAHPQVGEVPDHRHPVLGLPQIHEGHGAAHPAQHPEGGGMDGTLFSDLNFVYSDLTLSGGQV